MDKATRQLRNQMLDYLGQLVERRKVEDMRHDQVGTHDPMRAASGRSALDSAVVQAEEIIRSLDRVLEAPTPEVTTFRTTCNGLSRLRNSHCA